MNNIKESIKTVLSNNSEGSEGVKSNPLEVDSQKNVEPVKKKKRRGRPSKQTRETKLNKILTNRGMTRKDLCDLIEETYPDEPMSPDAVSRIVSGSREHYSTHTLFRICGALKVTPNMVLNYENHIQ